MSLENDIQQKEFKSEYHKAIINLIYTHNYIVGLMADAFKQFDITRQQYNVLRILRGQYPKHASVNLIKDRMLDKMSDTSRIVERLRIKGLISREDCKSDKRAVEITITQEGLDLLDKMEGPIDQFENELHILSPEETRALNDLLDKIRAKSTSYHQKSMHIEELMNQQEKF